MLKFITQKLHKNISRKSIHDSTSAVDVIQIIFSSEFITKNAPQGPAGRLLSTLFFSIHLNSYPMSKINKPGGDDAGFDKPLYVPIKRRSFFMYAGATAGATALLLSGCDDDEVFTEPTPPAPPTTPTPTPPGSTLVNVGSGSVGVLNYAFALEQLEAAFYTQVRTGTYYAGANAAEKQIFDDLYYHEVIHREFFKAALGAAAPSARIKDLEPNFAAVNFNDRTSVLATAKAFEDLGVAAYNGAGRFIDTSNNAGLQYLVLAGKIVSVEARHAALIRDLVTEADFVGADVVAVATTGLEISKTPAQVVATANTFLREGSKLDVSGLV